MAEYQESTKQLGGRNVRVRVYNDGRVQYFDAATGKATGPANVNVGAAQKGPGIISRLGTGLSAGVQNITGQKAYKSGNKFLDAITGAGRFVGTEFLGADDLRRAAQKASAGDIRGAGKSLFAGAAELGSTFATGGLGKKGVTMAGKAVAPRAGKLIRAADIGQNIAGVGIVGQSLYRGATQDKATPGVRVPQYDSQLDIAKARAYAAGKYSGPMTPLQLTLAKGFKEKATQGTTTTTTPVAGGGAGGAGKTVTPSKPSTFLPGVSVEEQLALDEQRRAAQAQYEGILSGISTQRTQGSIGAQGAARGAGRAAIGSSLDLGSALAESGYSAAPAQLGVGRAAISEQEAAERSAAAQGFTDLQSQLASTGLSAEQARRQALLRLLGLETSIRAGRSAGMLNEIYGGK